jgi:aspartyl-tRNA(Asn)/glutamyl-tRNA(Gln) amidotransferase subunit A
MNAVELPLGVAALAAGLAQGALTSEDATRAYLARIAARDAPIRSFICVLREAALEQARAADARRKSGASLGPLDGVPVGVKDNIDVAGAPTSGGIALYRDRAAAHDAFVIQRLRAAGAVILGKLNMHEAALGATTANSWFGRCENPHRAGYTPGGSSGGSGAAVAAGFCAGALGTDTLGSVRVPASYCGTAGFKPTFGLVSTRGVLPLSWTLDHVGFLAPRVADLGVLFDACAGFDRESAYARRGPRILVPKRADPANLAGLRIGRLTNLECVALEPDVARAGERALDALAGLGASVVDVTLEGYDFTRMRREGLLVSEFEAASVFEQDLAAHPDGFSDVLRANLAFGAKQSAVRAAQAYRRLAEARVAARRVFAQVDVLVLPTTPQVAFPFAAPVPVDQADLTGFANIVGIPAGCVPFGRNAAGLPLSVQVMASAFEDRLALDVLGALEIAFPGR